MQRVLSKLSFANVISVIALFVALGGAAYAGGKIGKNSITGKQVKESTLVPVCPSNAKARAGDACFAPQHAGDDWDVAARDCASKGLSLPSVGQALLITNKVDSDFIWTDEVSDGPNNRIIVRTEDTGFSRIATTPKGGPILYRCVSSPR